MIMTNFLHVFRFDFSFTDRHKLLSATKINHYMKLKIGWWLNWFVFLFLLFLYLISKLLISFMFLTILYTRIWERNNNYILLYHFEPFRPTPNHSHGYQGGLLLNLEDIQPVLTLILTPFLKSETCFMHGAIVWQRIAFKLYHIGRHFLN